MDERLQKALEFLKLQSHLQTQNRILRIELTNLNLYTSMVAVSVQNPA